MLPATLSEPFGKVSVNVEPLPADELLTVNVPLVLAVIETLPVEFAASVVADVELTFTPPVPAETVRFGVVKVDVDTVPPADGLAVSEIEDVAESGLERVMLPAVEFKDRLGAEILESPVSVIELADEIFA